VGPNAAKVVQLNPHEAHAFTDPVQVVSSQQVHSTRRTGLNVQAHRGRRPQLDPNGLILCHAVFRDGLDALLNPALELGGVDNNIEETGALDRKSSRICEAIRAREAPKANVHGIKPQGSYSRAHLCNVSREYGNGSVLVAGESVTRLSTCMLHWQQRSDTVLSDIRRSIIASARTA